MGSKLCVIVAHLASGAPTLPRAERLAAELGLAPERKHDRIVLIVGSAMIEVIFVSKILLRSVDFRKSRVAGDEARVVLLRGGPDRLDYVRGSTEICTPEVTRRNMASGFLVS